MAQGAKACPRQQSQAECQAKGTAQPCPVHHLAARSTRAGWRAVLSCPLALCSSKDKTQRQRTQELSELHSSQHKGAHSEERDNQRERHVCRQASSSTGPPAKFPAITGTKQGEMLLDLLCFSAEAHKTAPLLALLLQCFIQLWGWALQHVEQILWMLPG